MNFVYPARLSVFFVILTILMGVAAPICRANVTIFAKFSTGTGNWAGDITRVGSTGEWIELQSISTGASAEVSFTQGGVSAVSFKPVSIVKPVNKLSPQFFSSLTTGTAVPSQTGGDVIIEFVKTVGTTRQTIMRLELDIVYFTGLDADTSQGSDDVQETLTLVYNAQRLTVWPVVGTTLGTPKVSSWSKATGSINFN